MREIFKNQSVQAKLRFIVLTISSSLIVLMAIIFIVDKVRSHRRGMVENYSMLAESLSISAAASLVFDDKNSATEVLTSLRPVNNIILARIYKPDGEEFASYFSNQEFKESAKQNQTPPTFMQQIKKETVKGVLHVFSKQYLDFVAPIHFDDKIIGYITIKSDLEELNNRLILSIAIVIALIVTIGGLAQLISYNLQKSISKPLLDLLETMEAIRKDKKYTYRVNITNQDEFGTLAHEFNAMLSEIEERDRELARHGSQLEALVDKRTEELLQSNKMLQLEIEERKVIQGQLARAQRMEAIGTLAGGVAHDLNNILSGILSYPELLLMQIDKDHEMYGPLKTIETSGKKAAAIVQDLLTLARRGGMASEVTDLRKVVNDYLSSAECIKMLEGHPHVRIMKQVEDDLLMVEGSAVHLSKALMNLVTNAAEAIVGDGFVIIQLENAYLNSPIEGYEKVVEGNYVLLKVKDNGHGIPAEDLKYIFEPFYTKKKMGMSGTGLGMAVVWGTVEDHNGYIDVVSAEEEGTEFSIYFPATMDGYVNKKPEEAQKYKGSGESILVVDDVEEQRIIASAILKQLGYQVDSASSGEEAVSMLKSQSYDLLVLDMIMEPGIDGIETYRRALQENNDQKAIVATGYTDNKRLEIAKELGISGILRKPYTIISIAKIVREELERA